MESWFPRGMPEDVSEITLDYDLDTNTEDGTVLVSSAGQVAWRAALSRSRCPLDVAGDCFRDSLGDNSCAVVIFRAPSSIVRFRDCALLER